jgi:glycine/D-amino acid oxidase-like deaminating enzyme
VRTHEVVIVGAGLAGAATAFHLRRAGVADVVLLEREGVPGVHSSGRNASLLRERVDHPDLQPMAHEGAAALRSGDLGAFRRNGSVLLGLGDDDAAARMPWARGRGLWCPDDGVVDVAQVLATYLAGQDVRWRSPLLGWRREAERLVLHVPQGEIGARVLVNAAGAWAGEVGGLPMTPTNRSVFVTEPLAGVDPDWPFVWDVKGGLYFRPELGGLLLCPCDETPAAPGSYLEDPGLPALLEGRVRALQPGLPPYRLAYRWVGQRTFSPDRNLVLGFDPREPRLFHVAGLGGHGVTLSFALGRQAAALLEAGPTRAGQFSAARFVSAGA